MKNNLSAKAGRIWKKFSGAVKALVATAVVLFACTAWAKTYTQSALTNGRKWWYLSMRIVVQHTRRPYR